MRTFRRHFDVVFGCFVFGLRSHAFQSVLFGLYRTFFIIGGMDCSCLRLLFVLPWLFVGFALTAVGSIVLADTVMEKPDH